MNRRKVIFWVATIAATNAGGILNLTGLDAIATLYMFVFFGTFMIFVKDILDWLYPLKPQPRGLDLATLRHIRDAAASLAVSGFPEHDRATLELFAHRVDWVIKFVESGKDPGPHAFTTP